MNKEEFEALDGMVSGPGWKVYLRLIDTRFQRELLSLRKKKKDSSFDKANGFMDGLDCAKSIVEEEMSEFSHNPQTEGG